MNRHVQVVLRNVDSYVDLSTFHLTPYLPVPIGPPLHDAGLYPVNCAGSLGNRCGDPAKLRPLRPRVGRSTAPLVPRISLFRDIRVWSLEFPLHAG